MHLPTLIGHTVYTEATSVLALCNPYRTGTPIKLSSYRNNLCHATRFLAQPSSPALCPQYSGLCHGCGYTDTITGGCLALNKALPVRRRESIYVSPGKGEYAGITNCIFITPCQTPSAKMKTSAILLAAASLASAHCTPTSSCSTITP